MRIVYKEITASPESFKSPQPKNGSRWVFFKAGSEDGHATLDYAVYVHDPATRFVIAKVGGSFTLFRSVYARGKWNDEMEDGVEISRNLVQWLRDNPDFPGFPIPRTMLRFSRP